MERTGAGWAEEGRPSTRQVGGVHEPNNWGHGAPGPFPLPCPVNTATPPTLPSFVSVMTPSNHRPPAHSTATLHPSRDRGCPSQVKPPDTLYTCPRAMLAGGITGTSAGRGERCSQGHAHRGRGSPQQRWIRRQQPPTLEHGHNTNKRSVHKGHAPASTLAPRTPDAGTTSSCRLGPTRWGIHA